MSKFITMRFGDSANFKPYGPHVKAELLLTVKKSRQRSTENKALKEGWGLAEVCVASGNPEQVLAMQALAASGGEKP